MCGVCATILTTVAVCQCVVSDGSDACSVIRVPLFTPRIAIHVIAAELPEAGFVALGELKLRQPLGGLPKIQDGAPATVLGRRDLPQAAALRNA